MDGEAQPDGDGATADRSAEKHPTAPPGVEAAQERARRGRFQLHAGPVHGHVEHADGQAHGQEPGHQPGPRPGQAGQDEQDPDGPPRPGDDQARPAAPDEQAADPRPGHRPDRQAEDGGAERSLAEVEVVADVGDAGAPGAGRGAQGDEGAEHRPVGGAAAGPGRQHRAAIRRRIRCTGRADLRGQGEMG